MTSEARTDVAGYADRLSRKLDRLRAVVAKPRLFISEYFFSLRNQIDIRAEEILMSKKITKPTADHVNRLRSNFLDKLSVHERFCLAEYEKQLDLHKRNAEDAGKRGASLAYFKREVLEKEFDFEGSVAESQDFLAYYLHLERLSDEIKAFLLRNKFFFFNTKLVVASNQTKPPSPLSSSKPEPIQNQLSLGYLIVLDLDDLVLCRNARKLFKELDFGQKQYSIGQLLNIHCIKKQPSKVVQGEFSEVSDEEEDEKATNEPKPVVDMFRKSSFLKPRTLSRSLLVVRMFDLYLRRIVRVRPRSRIDSASSTSSEDAQMLAARAALAVYHYVHCKKETLLKELVQTDSLKLMTLDLAVIEDNAFEFYAGLKRLNLSYNKLQFDAQQLDSMPRPFGSLVGLEYLSIDSNRVGQFNYCLFTDLKDLKLLSLSNNAIERLDEVCSFRLLVNLRELDLGKNKIQSIDTYKAFGDLSRLVKLVMSHNSLERLGPDVFRDLKRLETLDLSENKLVHLDDDAFTSLERLKSLNLSFNKIITLEKNSDLFRTLANLVELNLSGNKIDKLNPDLFTSLAGLVHLNLACNQLEYVDENLFANQSQLETLQLHQNRIKYLFKESLNGLARLRQLYLFNNQLGSVNPEAFVPLMSLEILDMNTNSLESLKPEALSYLTRLKYLNLKNNSYKHGRDSLIKALNKAIASDDFKLVI